MYLLQEFKDKHDVEGINDMIEDEHHHYEYLEILEYDLLVECLTEYNPKIKQADNQLVEISNCTDYIYSMYDFLAKEYIMKHYLRKLRREIDKMKAIDVNIKCNAFTQNRNEAIITFNNINKSSISLKNAPNEIIINWNGCDAQKPSFEYMHNPLICLLGISEFEGITCCNLPAVKYDMLALRRLFEGLYGFKVFHKNEHMFWSREEIKAFFDQCITNVLKCKGWHGQDAFNKIPQLDRNDPLNGLFDGIVVIISTHGGRDCIFDSFENPYKLHEIYKQFGSDYPALISIPRVFIIDACRGSDTMNENTSNTKTGDLEQEQDEKQPTKTHKGSNRVTLFGNSPGIATKFDSKEDSTNGCSYFIKSIIKTFRQYEKDKNCLYTPTLSDIIFDIKLELSKLTTLQIPYKNGDVKLDKLKIFKKKILHPYDNPYKIYDLDAGESYIHEFTHGTVLVRCYKNLLNPKKSIILDSSKMSMKELYNPNIEEEFPKRCRIKNIKIIPNTNNEIVYIIHPITNDGDYDDEQETMEVKLHSIVCVVGRKDEDRVEYTPKTVEEYEEILRQNEYGFIKNAQKHRFMKIEVINNCNNFELKACDDSYFEECKFLKFPRKKIFNNGGKQIFYIVGQTLNKNDPCYYNELCQSGVLCVLKYKIIPIQNNNDDENKYLIVAIRSSEETNKLIDLAKPMYNSWIGDNKLVEQQNLNRFLNKFNDNVNNYKNHSYLQLLHDNLQLYWKLTVTIDIDASGTQQYDHQSTIFLIYGYLRQNTFENMIDFIEIVKCICKYFSVYNVYASGRNLCGELGIGNAPILNLFTKISSMSCLIHLQNNESRNWLKMNQEESFVVTQNGEIFVSDRDSGLLHLLRTNKSEYDIECVSNGLKSTHTLFVKNNDLYGMGSNNKKQLCDKRKRMFSEPILLYNINQTFNNTKIKHIKCGAGHTLILCQNGKLWAAGNNRMGECGMDTVNAKINTITLIKQLNHVTVSTIDVGRAHNLCLDNNNQVWCFGANAWGELGQEWKRNNVEQKIVMMDDNCIVKPMINHNIKDLVIDVKCGDRHSLCLTKQHQIYLFGKNIFGQIGDGLSGPSARVKIPYLHQNIQVRNASLGNNHTVLIPFHTDSLYVFGYNKYHQCSVQLDDQIIDTPYILTKKEIGLAETDCVQDVFAGNDNTVIVVKQSLLSQNNNIYL